MPISCVGLHYYVQCWVFAGVLTTGKLMYLCISIVSRVVSGVMQEDERSILIVLLGVKRWIAIDASHISLPICSCSCCLLIL